MDAIGGLARDGQEEDHFLGSKANNWRDVFKHQKGIRSLDRGDAKPLADLSSDGTRIQYNIPFFVGNLAIGEYSGSDATDFFRGRYGSSLVTIWLGSNSNMPHMAGHVPDVMTFNAKGRPLSKYHGKGHKIGAGGVYQILLTNYGWDPLENPTHLRIFAGGDDAICISAIMITGYGGYAAMWTADTIIGCNNLELLHKSTPRNFDESTTVIQGYQPKCLWVDRDDYSKRFKKDYERPHGIELHIPSLIATPERQREWLKNPDLLCNQSPRQRFPTFTKNVGWSSRDFFQPMTYFDPRLEFEKGTLLDKIPERVLQWRPTNDQIGPDVYYTRFHENLGKIIDGESTKRSLDNTTETEIHQTSLSQQMLHPSERKLVVSHSSISARGKCLISSGNEGDIGDGSDYFSLQEKIYCDIILKTQFPQCDDIYKTNCFDTDMMMLRSELSVEEDLIRGNVTAGHVLRARNEAGAAPFFAPLYGIPYSNIVSIG